MYSRSTEEHDLSGMVFGQWFVLDRGEPYKNGNTRWLCRCKCGREVLVKTCSLVSGYSTRCRYCANGHKDLTGRKIGKWSVLHLAGRNRSGRFMWLCRCGCGVEKLVLADNLLTGDSTQCRACSNRSRRD